MFIQRRAADMRARCDITHAHKLEAIFQYQSAEGIQQGAPRSFDPSISRRAVHDRISLAAPDNCRQMSGIFRALPAIVSPTIAQGADHAR
jgi:hypothetical protein